MLFPFELEFVSAASSFADGVVKLPLLFLWKVVCPAGTGLVVACTNGFVAGGHPYPLRSLSLVDSPANPGHSLTWDTCPCKRATDPASVMLLLIPPNLAQTHFKCWKTLLTINTPTKENKLTNSFIFQLRWSCVSEGLPLILQMMFIERYQKSYWLIALESEALNVANIQSACETQTCRSGGI